MHVNYIHVNSKITVKQSINITKKCVKMDASNPIIRLPPEKLPKNFLNLAAVMGYGLPLISPMTMQPATPEEALMIFPEGVVAQEMNFVDR